MTWRHQMETFSALLALCRGFYRSPVISPQKGQWGGALRFFSDQRLNKRLNKQSRDRWYKMAWHSLWLHCNKQVKQHWRIWPTNHLDQILVDITLTRMGNLPDFGTLPIGPRYICPETNVRKGRFNNIRQMCLHHYQARLLSFMLPYLNDIEHGNPGNCYMFHDSWRPPNYKYHRVCCD